MFFSRQINSARFRKNEVVMLPQQDGGGDIFSASTLPAL